MQSVAALASPSQPRSNYSTERTRRVSFCAHSVSCLWCQSFASWSLSANHFLVESHTETEMRGLRLPNIASPLGLSYFLSTYGAHIRSMTASRHFRDQLFYRVVTTRKQTFFSRHSLSTLFNRISIRSIWIFCFCGVSSLCVARRECYSAALLAGFERVVGCSARGIACLHFF